MSELILGVVYSAQDGLYGRKRTMFPLFLGWEMDRGNSTRMHGRCKTNRTGSEEGHGQWIVPLDRWKQQHSTSSFEISDGIFIFGDNFTKVTVIVENDHNA